MWLIRLLRKLRREIYMASQAVEALTAKVAELEAAASRIVIPTTVDESAAINDATTRIGVVVDGLNAKFPPAA